MCTLYHGNTLVDIIRHIIDPFFIPFNSQNYKVITNLKHIRKFLTISKLAWTSCFSNSSICSPFTNLLLLGFSSINHQRRTWNLLSHASQNSITQGGQKHAWSCTINFVKSIEKTQIMEWDFENLGILPCTHACKFGLSTSLMVMCQNFKEFTVYLGIGCWNPHRETFFKERNHSLTHCNFLWRFCNCFH